MLARPTCKCALTSFGFCRFALIAWYIALFIGLPLFEVWRQGNWDCIAALFLSQGNTQEAYASQHDDKWMGQLNPKEAMDRPAQTVKPKCSAAAEDTQKHKSPK
jgi:hypothetical protein